MKQSIGTVWITGLVITFMLIFSGYLAVTISYSSAIKDKNYILSIIEKKNGMTTRDGVATNTTIQTKGKQVYYGFGALETINLFLRGSSYNQKGSCGESVGDGNGLQWYGVKNLYKNDNPVNASGGKATVNVDYEKITDKTKNNNYYYCFAKIVIDNKIKSNKPTPAYYRIRLFYALQLPIVDALVFTIDGKTDTISKPSTCEIKDYRTGWSCQNT